MLEDWGRFRSEWEALPSAERTEMLMWWSWKNTRTMRIQQMQKMQQEAQARMKPSSGSIPRAPRGRR